MLSCGGVCRSSVWVCRLPQPPIYSVHQPHWHPGQHTLDYLVSLSPIIISHACANPRPEQWDMLRWCLDWDDVCHVCYKWTRKQLAITPQIVSCFNCISQGTEHMAYIDPTPGYYRCDIWLTQVSRARGWYRSNPWLLQVWHLANTGV